MMRLRTLAAMAAFFWIPAAQAHTMVWFETLNVNGHISPGFPGGGAGTMLNLFCHPFGAPTPCTWQIQMRAAVGAGLQTWSLDLRTAPGNGVNLSNPQIEPGPFNIVTSPGTIGSGLSLLYNAHGVAAQPPQPQVLTLMTFTLTRTLAPGDLTIATISGGPSSNLELGGWFNEIGDYEVVQFGPNLPAPGAAGTIGVLPLIWMGTPEPATLSMLFVGVLICLPRRAPRRRNRYNAA